ncbi:MAG: NUDIX domain-containing protein [Leptospiraceae bacterium]|nr:NUDIX domain-containing protein [Leptospiraceae bacterium]
MWSKVSRKIFLSITCDTCSQITYSNPIPVAVILLPVDEEFFWFVAELNHRKSKLALPGGFIETGETWQEGGARELREEAGVIIQPKDVKNLWFTVPMKTDLFLFSELQNQ